MLDSRNFFFHNYNFFFSFISVFFKKTLIFCKQYFNRFNYLYFSYKFWKNQTLIFSHRFSKKLILKSQIDTIEIFIIQKFFLISFSKNFIYKNNASISIFHIFGINNFNNYFNYFYFFFIQRKIINNLITLFYFKTFTSIFFLSKHNPLAVSNQNIFILNLKFL